MNPEQHVSAAPLSAGSAPMRPEEEALVDRLMYRVQSLEEEKRRWKTIGIISLALLLLVLVGGTAVVGLAAISSLGASRYQQQRFQALEQAEMQAQIAAEQARLQAEQQRQEAERIIQEAERQRAKANEK